MQHVSYPWLNARLQYLQCFSTGDTAVLHYAIHISHSQNTSCMSYCQACRELSFHNDVIQWKHFLCYWPSVQGIQRSLVNSLHKGQWHWALMFSLICAWINGWENNHEAGDLKRHRAHYNVTLMFEYLRGNRVYYDRIIVYNNPQNIFNVQIN